MPFVHPVTVRFFEVDLQRVVFNMWYLGWLDDAMTAYLADRGFPYDVMTGADWDVQLVHTDIDWQAGATFGDQLAVEVTTDRLGTTSLTLAFRVLRGDEVIATATTVYVVVGTDGTGKRPLPDALRSALSAAGA